MAEAWTVRGKVCVVTGASSGIGLEAARSLARQGAQTVLVCRSAARGEAARAGILASAPGAAVDLVLADLSSQAQVRRAAAEIGGRCAQVHVLLNNAGGLFKRMPPTPEGLEHTFALNHLGYFLLTNLLLPKLKASAPSRVVSVASRAHWGARWDWGNLQGQRSYRGLSAYCNSKLANILFTFELARRLEGTQVTANAAHPGFVRSRFGNSASLPLRVGVGLAKPFGISVVKGADTVVWAASAPELSGVTGKYFARRAQARTSAQALDETMAKRLWELSERLTAPAPAAGAPP